MSEAETKIICQLIADLADAVRGASLTQGSVKVIKNDRHGNTTRVEIDLSLEAE